MTIVTLVSGCGNAYPADGTRDGGANLAQRMDPRHQVQKKDLSALQYLAAAVIRGRGHGCRSRRNRQKEVLSPAGK